MFLSDLKLLINDFGACEKLNTSHQFPVWNSKGSEKKLEIREGRRGEQFWRRGGGDKMFLPPVIGYGYFLESPNVWKCGQRQT